jgi:hypothetical protein
MQMNNLQFEIQNEQSSRLNTATEVLLINFFAIISALVLPQLIFQYLFQNGQLDASQSAMLTNLPGIAYGVAAVAFVYAVITNFLRVRRIRQLKQDMNLMQYALSDDEDSSSLAEALQAAETKASTVSTKATSAKRSAVSKVKSTPRKSAKRRSAKKTE